MLEFAVRLMDREFTANDFMSCLGSFPPQSRLATFFLQELSSVIRISIVLNAVFILVGMEFAVSELEAADTRPNVV